MKKRNTIQYAKLAIITGAILIVISIACFIYLSIAIENGTVADFKDAYETAKAYAKYDPDNSAAYYLGISGFKLFMVRLAIFLRVSCLILGLIALGIGILIRVLNNDPDALDKVKAGGAYVVGTISTGVKESIERATVKCPKCGKVNSSKLSFCPNCGEKLPKYTPAVSAAPGKAIAKCSGCGKEFFEKIAFCTDCGQKVIAISTEVYCPACGEKNATTSKFCCACGASLGGSSTAVDVATACNPESKPEELVIRATPPARTATSADAPSAEPEKKNPFMNKPSL